MKATRCGMADCERPACQTEEGFSQAVADELPSYTEMSETLQKARMPGDWLQSLSSAERKQVAVSRGLFAYFPDALALIARHSVRANEKHNPGEPVHWAREKSNDHEDCIGRHTLAVAIDENSLDGGEPHIICRAWRSLAALQEWAEKQNAV